MRKNIKARGLAIILVIVSFMALVSIPAVYTGVQLAFIGEDIQHYNSQTIKTDEMTAMIQVDFDLREELMQSSHPVISAMANNSSMIWIPLFLIVGVMPIYMGIKLICEINRRLKFI